MHFRNSRAAALIPRDYYSKVWFIVSVVITVFLIILLIWNLIHNYRTVQSFENRELVLERASGELLFHTKKLEMSARMAAATGDLKWQDTYHEHLPGLKKTLNMISGIIISKEVETEADNIRDYLAAINCVEEQVFNLISHGRKEEAVRLLSGWIYTENQLNLKAATDNLALYLQEHVKNTISMEQRLTSAFLFIVMACLVVLVIAWMITIRIWRINLKKKLEKEEQILYLSYHDSLTGLYNRRFFEDEYERLNDDCYMPLSIIIGDVNGLKPINDNLGHKKGDELLIEIAGILKKSVREGDIVSRWGGDEYGIILPNAGYEATQKVIEDITDACDKSEFKPVKPSISLGFAVKTEVTQEIEKIFTNAENEMYLKKRANASSREAGRKERLSHA